MISFIRFLVVVGLMGTVKIVHVSDSPNLEGAGTSKLKLRFCLHSPAPHKQCMGPQHRGCGTVAPVACHLRRLHASPRKRCVIDNIVPIW